MYQTTCRSSRVATVLLTQNVGNIEAALGGSEKGKTEAASLFGNLNTKIMHCNGDPVTNEWAATIIGRTRQCFANGTNSSQSADWMGQAVGLGSGGQTSSGFSEAFEFEVQPSAFTELRAGGPENEMMVDGIVFQNGRKFAGTKRPWMRAAFRQEQQS
jgi:hypothetical protein